MITILSADGVIMKMVNKRVQRRSWPIKRILSEAVLIGTIGLTSASGSTIISSGNLSNTYYHSDGSHVFRVVSKVKYDIKYYLEGDVDISDSVKTSLSRSGDHVTRSVLTNFFYPMDPVFIKSQHVSGTVRYLPEPISGPFGQITYTYGNNNLHVNLYESTTYANILTAIVQGLSETTTEPDLVLAGSDSIVYTFDITNSRDLVDVGDRCSTRTCILSGVIGFLLGGITLFVGRLITRKKR